MLSTTTTRHIELAGKSLKENHLRKLVSVITALRLIFNQRKGRK